MVLEYADRLFKQKERLKKQTERIRAQTGRRGGVAQRRRIEEERVKLQKKRILEQEERAYERVHGARGRGEAVTGVDKLERKKVARELRWKVKWDRRRAKLDKWESKYMRPEKVRAREVMIKGGIEHANS